MLPLRAGGALQPLPAQHQERQAARPLQRPALPVLGAQGEVALQGPAPVARLPGAPEAPLGLPAGLRAEFLPAAELGLPAPQPLLAPFAVTRQLGRAEAVETRLQTEIFRLVGEA